MNIVGFDIRGQVECGLGPLLVVDSAPASHLVTVATSAKRVCACNTSCFVHQKNRDRYRPTYDHSVEQSALMMCDFETSNKPCSVIRIRQNRNGYLDMRYSPKVKLLWYSISRKPAILTSQQLFPPLPARRQHLSKFAET